MKRTPSRRADRLADQIAREIALALAEDVKDPRLELVTISGAALNADMSIVRIYYTLSGDEARLAAAAKGLEQAKGFLRTLLGHRLRIRSVPELRFARDIPAEFAEHARHMTFIMLDHVLGEYDFAVKVGAVDFVGEDDYDADVSWTPLSQLPPVFDAFWTQTLGHTGHFPQGEPQWEGLELEFNCAVDDEGNPVDDPEGDAETGGSDEGVVAVNLAANAVAMRADLPYALTLDLAVPDSAALAAAQNLQEQAATLLQLPQLGVAALTLVRAGRRQALFYVSDEQLAKQTLAPLLLRDEAATLELKLRYDPAWTGYFEYAGYLLH